MKRSSKIIYLYSIILNFEYQPLQKTTQLARSIDPYHLVCQRGNWYVIGYDHFKDDVNGNGKLIHFATLRTILPIYQVEKRKVDYVWEHGCGWTIPTMLLNMIVAYTKSLALCIMSLKKIIIKRKVI